MAAHLYILAALVALFSTTKSLPKENNKLNELLSKTKFDGEKSSVFLSNDVNKDSESIKLNQKGSSFLRTVPCVGSKETIFKQTGNEKNKINLKDENWNLRKWLQNVMDLVRKLDIENLVGKSNDKELLNNTNAGFSIDKAKESDEKSNKAKFLEIYPIVYVPELKKEQTTERTKFKPLFGNSLSPTLKKQSSKKGYDFDRSFDKDSLESYEEGDPCDYESDEPNDGVIKATTNSKNIKHMTTKTTNTEIRLTSANEKTTKLLTDPKIIEKHKNSHTTPTLEYIQTSKTEPLHKAAINKATSENSPDSSYVTQNSSVTNIIPNDNDVEKSSIQNNDSQVNLSTNNKMPFPISNFSNQEIIGVSPSGTNKTTLSIDSIQVPSNTKPMDIGRKNDQALFEPLTEAVENVNSSPENPAHHVETIKINNDQHESPDSTHSFIPVQIPSNQQVTKQIQKDNELPSKTLKNMLIQAPKLDIATKESQVSDQKSTQPTTKSSDIIQNIPHEKPVAQKTTESHNILQTGKDIPLTESLVSSEVLDKNPNIDQNILQSVTPTLISFQDMPSEVPTEKLLNDKQNILSSVPDNQHVSEKIDLKNIPKNSLENNQVILPNQKITNEPITNDEIIFQTINSSSFSQNSVSPLSPDIIQISPFTEVLNTIPNDDLNEFKHSIPSLDIHQSLPNENKLVKIPDDNQNKYPYSTSSFLDVQNSPIDKVSNKNPNDQLQNPITYFDSNQRLPFEDSTREVSNLNLKKLHHPSPTPDDTMNPSIGRLFNRISSNEQKNLQNPIPSYDALQNSPVEEAFDKIPSGDKITSQYFITSSDNINNSPIEGILSKIPDGEENKLEYPVHSLNSLQNSPIESILNKIPSDNLNKSQYFISSPNNIQNLPVEGVINNIPSDEQNKLQYPETSLNSIQNSPTEEILNKIPGDVLNKSQYSISYPNNIQNLPVEGVLSNIPNDERNKLQNSAPSLGAFQNSPIEGVLNQIPSEDLNKLQYFISSPNSIQNLPVEEILDKIPNHEQDKLENSVPSLGSIQNSPTEEILNEIPINDLNKSQYLISSPNNIQNLPIKAVLNKTPSEKLTKVQNLIPSLEDIQSQPIEDEINKVPSDEIDKLKPYLDNSQKVNASISEETPENNNKKNVQTNDFPTSQQNPEFQSNVGEISIKQDSTPILNFNQNIPVQYDHFENGQETNLKPQNKGTDHKLSPLDNMDKILEDNKHVLHFTTPYPIVVQNSSNQISTEQPETDSKNMSLPASNIPSENTESIIISNLPKNSDPQQSSQQPIQNLPNEKSFSIVDKKATDNLPLSLPETREETDLVEENIPEKLTETSNEEQFINFSEIDSSDDLTENEDYEYFEEEIEDDSSEDDKDSYSSEDDYDDLKEGLTNLFPKHKDDISSKKAPVQYSSSTAPSEIKKQVDEKEEEKSYDTFLQFLYRHSNSHFIQSLRENSTLS